MAGLTMSSGRTQGGRGVRRSLVRQLVERRGGWVEIEDTPDGNGGAVLTAWLPEAVRSAQGVTT